MTVKEWKDLLDDCYGENEKIIMFFFSKGHFDELGIDISEEQWSSIVEQASDINLVNVVEEIEEIIISET